MKWYTFGKYIADNALNMFSISCPAENIQSVLACLFNKSSWIFHNQLPKSSWPIVLMITNFFLDENKDSDGNGITNGNCSPRWLSPYGFYSPPFRGAPQSVNRWHAWQAWAQFNDTLSSFCIRSEDLNGYIMRNCKAAPISERYKQANDKYEFYDLLQEYKNRT